MAESVDLGFMTSHIAGQLRQMIFDRELVSNEPIRQAQIAERFGTSRIPVREALRQLESEGLVVIRPNSGARVALLDLDECIDTYKLRERLEPLAISESIPNLDATQLDRIAHLAQELRVEGPDPAAWLKHDLEFHLATYAGVPSQRLMKMIEGLWNTTHHYRRVLFTTFTPRDFEIANLEHTLIHDAVVTRNTEHAEYLLRAHIERSRLRLAENAALFDAS